MATARPAPPPASSATPSATRSGRAPSRSASSTCSAPSAVTPHTKPRSPASTRHSTRPAAVPSTALLRSRPSPTPVTSSPAASTSCRHSTPTSPKRARRASRVCSPAPSRRRCSSSRRPIRTRRWWGCASCTETLPLAQPGTTESRRSRGVSCSRTTRSITRRPRKPQPEPFLMKAPQLLALDLAADPDAWTSLGFAVDEHEGCEVDGVALRLGRPEPRISGWALAGTSEGLDIDGLRTTRAPSPASPSNAPMHPNGTVAIDHLVVMTPDLERTIAALAEHRITPRRRRRTDQYGPPFTQTFFRLGRPILEVIGPDERSGEDPATLLRHRVHPSRPRGPRGPGRRARQATRRGQAGGAAGSPDRDTAPGGGRRGPARVHVAGASVAGRATCAGGPGGSRRGCGRARRRTGGAGAHALTLLRAERTPHPEVPLGPGRAVEGAVVAEGAVGRQRDGDRGLLVGIEHGVDAEARDREGVLRLPLVRELHRDGRAGLGLRERRLEVVVVRLDRDLALLDG